MCSTAAADAALDVTSDICPMTYVRVRLLLDRLSPGQTLAVRLRGEEAARSVPASAQRQGHAVLSQSESGDGTILLLLRKGSG